jgi:hypothetical protein
MKRFVLLTALLALPLPASAEAITGSLVLYPQISMYNVGPGVAGVVIETYPGITLPKLANLQMIGQQLE